METRILIDGGDAWTVTNRLKPDTEVTYDVRHMAWDMPYFSKGRRRIAEKNWTINNSIEQRPSLRDPRLVKKLLHLMNPKVNFGFHNGPLLGSVKGKVVSSAYPDKTRPAMNLERKFEVCSCNHCCSGKAIVTHSECVSAALVIQHGMRLNRIVICGLSGSTIFFHII